MERLVVAAAREAEVDHAVRAVALAAGSPRRALKVRFRPTSHSVPGTLAWIVTGLPNFSAPPQCRWRSLCKQVVFPPEPPWSLHRRRWCLLSGRHRGARDPDLVRDVAGPARVGRRHLEDARGRIDERVVPERCAAQTVRVERRRCRAPSPRRRRCGSPGRGCGRCA
jgi:hypothetical protein